MRPLPITGVAAVNALGGDRGTIVGALSEGRSGLGAPRIPLPFPTQVGAVEVPLPRLPAPLAAWTTHLSRLTAFLLEALDRELERVRRLLEERRIDLEVSEAAMDLLAERGYDPHYGARPLKRVIQRMLQDPLAMRILEGEFPEGSKVRVDRAGSGEALEFSRV